jgi:hypothetical protein
VDEQGACFLVDLGSTNKTKVLIHARKGEAEKVLEPHTSNKLTHHCTLTFADVQAQFLLVPTLEKEVRKHKKRGSTTKDKEKEKDKEKDKEKEKEKKKDNRRSTSLNDLRNTKREVRKSKRNASTNEFSLDVDILQPTGNKRPPIHSNTLPIYKTAPSSDKSIGRVTTVDAAFPEKPFVTSFSSTSASSRFLLRFHSLIMSFR